MFARDKVLLFLNYKFNSMRDADYSFILPETLARGLTLCLAPVKLGFHLAQKFRLVVCNNVLATIKNLSLSSTMFLAFEKVAQHYHKEQYREERPDNDSHHSFCHDGV